MNYKVYCHTCPSGKKYFGITCQNIKSRWGNGKRYFGRLFNEAVEKYGWDNIKHEILFDGLSREKAQKIEVELIALHNTTDKRFGYNILKGGRLGWKGTPLGEQHKRNIGNANRGNKRPDLAEYNKQTKKGVRLSNKTRLKMSIARRKKKTEAQSNASRANAEIARKSRMRKVKQIDFNGNILAVYPSLREAERQTNTNFARIRLCCNGEAKSSNGFIWRYANE